MKLNVKAFAITGAILCGVGLFLITWWIIIFGDVPEGSTFVGRVYLGYSVTPLGSIIGLAWAAVDGFIGGALFAWLYNLIASHSK